MNFLIFFIRAAIKTTVLVSWCRTPVSLCWSDDLQLEIQKICSYLKNVASNFVLLVLKLYTIQVVTTFTVKLTMGQLLLIFCETSATFLAAQEVS